MTRPILIITILTALLLLHLTDLNAAEPPNSLPDVRSWRTATYDESFFQGQTVYGEEALTFMWQSINWRSNPGGIPKKFSKLQRLLSGDAQQVAKINEEIQKQCRGVLADVGAWREKNKKSRKPTSWILLALRAPDKLTAETHASIRETLKAIDLGSKEAGYIGWMHIKGANGANVHGYLTPLVLAPALIDDPKVLAAVEQALLAELGHMNSTGDMGESTVIVEGKRILNIARCGKKALALLSMSEDHGRTWTPAAVSNLPMATSKPYAGILSTGQRYLVCTTTADTGGRRSPLTIAVSKPGESVFCKVFLVRTSISDQTPGGFARNADFSYPYAVEQDGKLYIGYTHKSHMANELAIVPTRSLTIEP